MLQHVLCLHTRMTPGMESAFRDLQIRKLYRDNPLRSQHSETLPYNFMGSARGDSRFGSYKATGGSGGIQMFLLLNLNGVIICLSPLFSLFVETDSCNFVFQAHCPHHPNHPSAIFWNQPPVCESCYDRAALFLGDANLCCQSPLV